MKMSETRYENDEVTVKVAESFHPVAVSAYRKAQAAKFKPYKPTRRERLVSWLKGLFNG